MLCHGLGDMLNLFRIIDAHKHTLYSCRVYHSSEAEEQQV